MTKVTFLLKGGSGSGHYGHAGRPGKKGGSLPGKGNSPAETDIREILGTFAGFKKQNMRANGFVHSSYEEIVLEKGRFYEPSNEPLPKGVRKGELKQCYLNTFRNMLPGKYIYTEGYGMVEGLPIPFEHAWLTTPDGKVIDPTWRDNKPLAYFGIQFTYEFVLETAERTGFAGVLFNDWMDDARILKNGLPDDAIYNGEK